MGYRHQRQAIVPDCCGDLRGRKVGQADERLQAHGEVAPKSWSAALQALHEEVALSLGHAMERPELPRGDSHQVEAADHGLDQAAGGPVVAVKLPHQPVGQVEIGRPRRLGDPRREQRGRERLQRLTLGVSQGFRHGR